MNIFYAAPDQISGSIAELRGQEARHVSRVLRYTEGDPVTLVDGVGGWYEGKISHAGRDSVLVDVNERFFKDPVSPERVLALGIIKKRDRLEFAVEKAVELGVTGIVLFRSAHTVKENVREDRLEATVLSAMKQSLRAWLPEISVFNSSNDVISRFPEYRALVAHEKSSPEKRLPPTGVRAVDEKFLLMVGPEGGFSEAEIRELIEQGADTISLGSHRLRTETAAIALLSHFSWQSV